MCILTIISDDSDVKIYKLILGICYCKKVAKILSPLILRKEKKIVNRVFARRLSQCFGPCVNQCPFRESYECPEPFKWEMVESTGAVACGVQTKEGTRLPTQIFEKLLWEGGLGLLRRQNISINISVQ